MYTHKNLLILACSVICNRYLRACKQKHRKDLPQMSFSTLHSFAEYNSVFVIGDRDNQNLPRNLECLWKMVWWSWVNNQHGARPYRSSIAALHSHRQFRSKCLAVDDVIYADGTLLGHYISS